MKARLMAIGVPAVLVGLLFGGAFTWKTLGMPPIVWNYVWPSLVAVALLAFGIGALSIRARALAWPLLAGFVTQLVGILLYRLDVHEKPIEALWWTLWTVAVVLFIVLAIWLATFLRARWLEKKMLEGVGAEGADQQKIQQIRKDMMGALGLLKKAGAGRNAIYELPWFLVIGRSQAGKTVAIKNSGLGLPVRKDWVKGVGGTHTCDWFFTNDLIFLDTPGAWVTEGASEDAQEYWKTLLKLLHKYRGRRPLDGLVVVVPADDLLSKTDEELQEQAGNIREVIDLLHDELHFRFPVYLLVSKCDLVEGFVDFFRRVPAQRWHEIVGWSNPDPGEGSPAELVSKGFQRVLRRLRAYRLELIARIGRARHARKIFFFPEDFKRLERQLAHFVDILFYEDPSHETPVFRGFYFTSGTQGEGSVLGQAMAQLARNLGVRLTAGSQQEEKEEPKRSYFLLELFRQLMVSDEGLVSRTAGHWWRRRRDTIFAAFLPASIAGALLFLSLLSYLLNSGVYSNAKEEVPAIVSKLGGLSPDPKDVEIEQALGVKEGGIEQIRRYHRSMTGFSVFRTFGMRRPGALADETFRIFEEQFERRALGPTIGKAQEAALDLDQIRSCNEQVDAFYAVVWLRGARKAESEDDLKAFERIWVLSPERAASARDLFLTQFRYLVQHRPGSRTFLPGFSLSNVASKIKADCFDTGGSGSALEAYLAFQRECRDRTAREDLDACSEKLKAALDYQNESYRRLREQVYTLKNDLEKLAHDRENVEPEARAAWETLREVEIGETSGNECLEAFNQEVAGTIKSYVKDQRDLIEECKDEIASSPNPRFTAAKFVQDQRKDEEGKIAETMKGWTKRCEGSLKGYNQVDPPVLFSFLRQYRQCRCLGERCPSTPLPPPPPPPPAPGRTVVRRAPVAPSGTRPHAYVYVRAPARPGQYTKRDWSNFKVEWQDRLDAAAVSGGGGERNRVRAAVEDYADRYVKAWRQYLEGVRLEKARGSVPAWLKGLSETTEFEEALRPAGEALSPEQPAKSEELDTFGFGLQRLGAVTTFVNNGLSQYKSKLRRVAADLARFETDSAYWGQYKQNLGSQDNSLYDARDWVEQNASGIAMGALRGLLMEPLDEAENYVKSSTSLVERRWDDLRKAYAKVADRMPFGGQKSDKLVELPELRALLGGQTGLVAALQDPAIVNGLGSKAREWLRQASELSALFFGEGQDDPKAFKLQHIAVEQEEFSFDPPKLEGDLRVEKIKIAWGGGEEFNWSQDKPDPGKAELQLFGDDASTFSEISMTPAEAGRGGITFRRVWKVTEARRIAPPRGAWAPLRLLAMGLPPGGAGAGSDLSLNYEFQVPIDKKKQGKIVVKIRVSAPKLGRLLQLAEKGMPAPPEHPTE